MQRIVLMLTVVLLAAAAAVGRPEGTEVEQEPVASWLDAYDERHQQGNLITYQDSASSLGGWNDLMRSACINGFWVFYEHDKYNYQSGRVLWAFGFNYCFTFLMDFDRQVSSVRRVGNYGDAAAPSITFYEGTRFSGNQVYTDSSRYNITSTYGYQSVIVSGPDAWTIYSGDNYTGYSVCLYSGSDSAVSPSGQTIQYGLFPTADYLGVVGSNIRSVLRGCYSKVKLWAEPPDPANHLSNFVEKKKSRLGTA